jgi:hypothetical protein
MGQLCEMEAAELEAVEHTHKRERETREREKRKRERARARVSVDVAHIYCISWVVLMITLE